MVLPRSATTSASVSAIQVERRITGGALTRSAVRVAAVLRQIRASTAFGTFDHCEVYYTLFGLDWVPRMST